MTRTQYRRGEGPNALPQGTASQLNNRLLPPESSEIPVRFSTPEEDAELAKSDMQPSDNLEILSADPNPAWRAPIVEVGAGGVPRSIIRNLPRMAAAAKDPDAPPAFKALYDAVVRRLANE